MTPKQQRFVDEYLIDLNATAAARRAGYSARTARSQGERLLTNVDVAAAVKKAQIKRAAKVEIKAEDVLRRLFIEADGDGPDTSSSARIKATELLGKHLGMFGDKHEVTLDDKRSITDLAREAYERRQRRTLAGGD